MCPFSVYGEYVSCVGYTAYPTANKYNTRKSRYVNSEAKIKAQAFIRVDISRLRVYNTT